MISTIIAKWLEASSHNTLQIQKGRTISAECKSSCGRHEKYQAAARPLVDEFAGQNKEMHAINRDGKSECKLHDNHKGGNWEGKERQIPSASAYGNSFSACSYVRFNNCQLINGTHTPFLTPPFAWARHRQLRFSQGGKSRWGRCRGRWVLYLNPLWVCGFKLWCFIHMHTHSLRHWIKTLWNFCCTFTKTCKRQNLFNIFGL